MPLGKACHFDRSRNPLLSLFLSLFLQANKQTRRQNWMSLSLLKKPKFPILTWQKVQLDRYDLATGPPATLHCSSLSENEHGWGPDQFDKKTNSLFSAKNVRQLNTPFGVPVNSKPQHKRYLPVYTNLSWKRYIYMALNKCRRTFRPFFSPHQYTVN